MFSLSNCLYFVHYATSLYPCSIRLLITPHLHFRYLQQHTHTKHHHQTPSTSRISMKKNRKKKCKKKYNYIREKQKTNAVSPQNRISITLVQRSGPQAVSKLQNMIGANLSFAAQSVLPRLNGRLSFNCFPAPPR